uniref:HIT domain-containing protein n=1 Tax=Leersia perrieri TaxID=77586 RepID=A0A0D9W7L3_9ORYZ
MKKLLCFRGGTTAARRRPERAPMADWVMAFQDINPSAFRYLPCVQLSHTASCWEIGRVVLWGLVWITGCDLVFPLTFVFRHYLVIPIEHIPTFHNLQRTTEDHQLVSHMLAVGRDLLNRDAPNSEEHRFGFHQPPFNSVDHLHLHCLALPFMPSWRQVKYTPLGPLGGFLEAESLLERIRP